ncbi:MAG: hypothetical protein AAFQ79_02765 [Pseudomonadota bacterium]
MKRFQKRQAITAAITFVIAIGAGHFMQSGIAGANRVATPDPRPLDQPLPLSYIETSTLSSALQSADPTPSERQAPGSFFAPRAPNVALVPATLPDLSGARPLLPDDTMRKPRSAQEYGLDRMGMDCRPRLSATAKPGAVAHLELTAPCDREARVDISHAGLAFAMTTDRTGALSIDVPVLANPAEFQVSLAGHDAIHAVVPVQNMRGHERVALQTSADQQLSIHALEFGASPGSVGHVSAASSSGIAPGTPGFGGYLVQLGDLDVPGAPRAEIYSFPTGQFGRTGVVRLQIEAHVTDATCGNHVTANAFQTRRSGPLRHIDVSVAMPGCEAVGDILVLKNVLQDLRVALN